MNIDLDHLDLELLGGSVAGFNLHLEENPDDTWEDYIELLDYAHRAEKGNHLC